MDLTADHASEVSRGERFEFGANWVRFLKVLNNDRIEQAENSLKGMLRLPDLVGKRFLDVGSGSGLFSLVARRLGASVYSFDYDPKAVACTQEIKRRYFPDDSGWTVEHASVLDREYLAKLGQFDVVYSWGVLHHTGAMWQALGNVASLVAGGGLLFIAIYNDEGFKSRYWHAIKRAYVGIKLLRWPLVILHMPYPFLPSLVFRIISGRLKERRGMSFWHDIVDWIGGYPFEVATPGTILDFYRVRGFRLDTLKTTNRSGCNQFVFVKEP